MFGVSRRARLGSVCVRRQAESLERRRLLAVTASLVPDADIVGAEVLRVIGTESAELIRVTYNASTNDIDVVVDGTTIFSTPTTRVYQIDINGLGGDDEIRVEAKRNASVNGGAGDDTIVAAAGDDTLVGDDGDDSLLGGSGVDQLRGDTGNDTIYGGGSRTNIFQGFYGGPGNDLVVGGSGNEVLDGAGGNDSLMGMGGEDRLIPGSGIDTLDDGSGLDEADYAETEDGNTRLNGLRLSLDGIANDGEVGSATGMLVSVETIRGSDGADLIVGDGNLNTLLGGSGNDTLLGQAGDDDLQGGEGDDQIDAGTGDDVYSDQLGSDLVNLGAGDDTVFAGSDVIAGDTSVDTLLGGAGADSFRLGKLAVVRAGRGDDVLNIVAYGSASALDLSGGGGRDLLTNSATDFETPGTSLSSDFTLDGVANDRIYAATTNNVRPDIEVFDFSDARTPVKLDGSAVSYRLEVIGGGGYDTLIGGAGSDKLRGGRGNDSIVGNAGTDFINGGKGQDFIDSADGVFDLVNGSSGGSDSVRRDAGLDDVSNAEILT